MFKIIGNLKRSDPQKRMVLLNRMHDKNIAYFRRQNPVLAEFIETCGTGRFEIRIDRTALEVLDRTSGQPCHPPGQLFPYMAEFGSWHHSGWVDKISIHHIWRGEGEHSELEKAFLEKIYADLPTLSGRLSRRSEVALPTLADGRKYSGAVVFLGIFTGLHIMQYLSTTVVRDFFLIEPDPERFALSCYFLDYEFLEQHFGGLMLHVGPDMPQSPVDILTGRSRITSSVWVRLLPAYPDGRFDEVINRVSLRWRALSEIFVPFDREVKNLQNGAQNIIVKRRLLHRPPKLSPGAVVAVVASGPSLNLDMGWLRDNQSRLIIMASISSVRVLKENGIRVDFQCTLDTEIDGPLLDRLQLDYDIPLVAYYKLDPDICRRFNRVYLLAEANKANVVRFKRPLDNTHPTTGNLTTAFAAWCKPARLIFFGLDMGYRDPKRSHAEGGWHDEDEGAGHDEETGGRDHIPVEGNFAETRGEIVTMAYYNNARFGVEAVLVGLNYEGCIVQNCSDGAKIAGAEPMRSKELVLPEYPGKQQDVAAIAEGFDTDYADIWEAYDTPGATLIEELKDDILDALTLEKGFNWPEWSAALDRVTDAAVDACVRRHREFRIEVYSKLIHDMLSEWYRTMLLTESHEEEQIVYQSGLNALRQTFDQLNWPEELDDFMPGKQDAEQSQEL
jgi:hypothetical protein